MGGKAIGSSVIVGSRVTVLRVWVRWCLNDA